jgi:hypothetical protein
MSIRIRLALIFAAPSALVIVVGSLIYMKILTHELHTTIDSGLAIQMQDIRTDLSRAGSTPAARCKASPSCNATTWPRSTVLPASFWRPHRRPARRRCSMPSTFGERSTTDSSKTRGSGSRRAVRPVSTCASWRRRLTSSGLGA